MTERAKRGTTDTDPEVTFTRRHTRLTVLNLDASEPLYVTFDGDAPAGPDWSEAYVVPFDRARVFDLPYGALTVRLGAAAPVDYSVEAVW
jgi:hypothetical protein